MKYETLQTYLEYLEKSHLIHQVPPYSKNILKQKSRNPKIYIGDHSFFLINGNDPGHMVETVAYNHCRRMIQKRCLKPPFYWANKAGEEVDMVIETGHDLLPIEIKNRSKIQKDDIKGILEFMKWNETLKPITVTKSEEGIITLRKRNGPDEVIKIPLWKFLLST